MRDNDQGLAVGLQGADDVFDLCRLLNPKCRGGLVHDDEFRGESCGAGNGHALALAARHFADGVAEVWNLDRGAQQGLLAGTKIAESALAVHD